MKIERAIEILDPNSRERYQSVEPVQEACLLGMDALNRRLPKPPFQAALRDGPECPTCGNNRYLHNKDGKHNKFCGQCGQAITWERVETEI